MDNYAPEGSSSDDLLCITSQFDEMAEGTTGAHAAVVVDPLIVCHRATHKQVPPMAPCSRRSPGVRDNSAACPCSGSTNDLKSYQLPPVGALARLMRSPTET